MVVYAYGHVRAKPSTAQLGSLQSHTLLKKTQLPFKETSILQWRRKDQTQVHFCLMDLISAISITHTKMPPLQSDCTEAFVAFSVKSM